MIAYSNSIQLDPQASLIYLLRSNVYSASGRHQEAIADYDKALTHIDRLHGVRRDVLYFNRGNSKAEAKDYEGAIEDYTEAITLNPDSSVYYYNRANAYANLYRFDEALADYDQVTGNESNNAAFSKGNTLLAMGQLSEARFCYQRAIASGLSNEGIRQNIWTLDQMNPLVDGLNYDLKAEQDPGTGTMCLRFKLPESATEVGQELGRYLLHGRAGNVGNTGGPGLSGGEGFPGKPFVRVYADSRSEDRN